MIFAKKILENFESIGVDNQQEYQTIFEFKRNMYLN